MVWSMDRDAQKVELSGREQQVLELAASGHTDAGIALALGISEPTVSTYWGRVRTKIGPFNRAELVAHFVRSETLGVLEELREANEVLRERLRAVGKGTVEHALYRSVIENAADAILVVTPDGLIVLANSAVREVFGWTPSNIEGRPVNDLIPERCHAEHNAHRSDYLAAPAKKRMGAHLATVALHADGHEFPIAATLSNFDSDGASLTVCIVRAV